MARPDIGYRAVALLKLGIKLADRHTQLRARFEYLSSGADEGQILIIRNLDQPVEHRVVEHLPPVTVLLIPGIDRRIAGF